MEKQSWILVEEVLDVACAVKFFWYFLEMLHKVFFEFYSTNFEDIFGFSHIFYGGGEVDKSRLRKIRVWKSRR